MAKLKPHPNEEERPVSWQCFDCGQINKGFYGNEFWTDCGYEYECVCSICESDNTGEEGCGDREEDCPVCHTKTEERVQADPICELCEGYASIFPYQLDQYKKRNKNG